MVATSGSRLLEENAANTLMEKLFPLADIITPNIPELEVISGRQIESTDDIIEASKAVYDKYGCPVLSKEVISQTQHACVTICGMESESSHLRPKEWIIQTHTAQAARFHQR